MLLGAAGIAGTLLAGGLGYYGQRKANKANIQSAREAMEFSHDEYSTQYQRSMEDMRKAGLNPILAARYGGGGAASGVQSQSQNEMSGVVSSALEAKRLQADLKLIRENTEKIKADTDSVKLMNKLAVIDQANKNLATRSNVRLQNAQGDLADSNILLNSTSAKGKLIEQQQMNEILKGMRLEGEIDDTTYGAIMRYIGRGTSVLPFVNASKRGSK